MTKNHCESCRHKQNTDGGHCYMFRHEPQDYCAQHTNVHVKTMNNTKTMAQHVQLRIKTPLRYIK